MSDTDINELSERELEILSLVATGATNREIATKLYISTNTVKVHVRNIYSKLGVASRTEATVHAIREGLVEMDSSEPDGGGAQEQDLEQGGLSSYRTVSQRSFATDWLKSSKILWVVLPLVLIIFVAALFFRLQEDQPVPAVVLSPPPVPTPTVPTWNPRADITVARSGMAVAVLDGKIYAIAGETEEGLTGRMERYDPVSDSWEHLADKPVQVSDVQAAVISGMIYVPGGRGTADEIMNVLEIFDPKTDTWSQGASLPQPLSAYAMVPFEGRLYVFGGWNGDSYLNTVYEYDPRPDQWRELTPMPTARGYAGASATGGSIFVLGGTDGEQALSLNEEYLLSLEGQGEPWVKRASLPAGRYGMGVVSIADIVYVVGGIGNNGNLLPLQYFPQRDEWQSFSDIPGGSTWSMLGLAFVDTYIHIIGGKQGEQFTTDHLSFKAIYTVAIPVVR